MRLCTCALDYSRLKTKNDDDHVSMRKDGGRVVNFRDGWYNLWVVSRLGTYVPAKRANGEAHEKCVGLNPRDFRRSATRNMTRRGAAKKVAVTISEHSTRSVFERYNSGDGSDLLEAARRIEAPQQPSVLPDQTQTKLEHADVPVS